MQEYQFQVVVNPSRLTQEIQQSDIITALDHISVLGETTSVFMKAELSSTDESILNDLIANHDSTPEEQTLPEVVVIPKELGTFISDATAVGTCSAGSTKTLDYKLVAVADESFQMLFGGSIVAKNYGFGDWVKFQVVDVDGIIYPAGTVLKTYIRKAYLDNNGYFFAYDSTGAELPVGLYLRATYNSAGGITSTQFAVNYDLRLKTE